MKVGITRFPGTNCDRDIFKAVAETGHQPQWLWHRDHFDPMSVDRIIVPGGFSFGDYLRSGALAAQSPVMTSVREAAKKGVPILGICNGFQILTEAQLLPGALLVNDSGRFVDRWVELKAHGKSPWLAEGPTKPMRLPVAHACGRYYISEDGLEKLWDQEQVWLSYVRFNPNGALDDIAGVQSRDGKIAALMPHPERAMHDWMGGTDGWKFFEKWETAA